MADLSSQPQRLDCVRVRYLLPLEVDVDLASGRVVGVALTAEPVPDEAAPALLLDERFDFRGPAAPELREAALAAVDDQLVAVSESVARVAVEVAPRD